MFIRNQLYDTKSDAQGQFIACNGPSSLYMKISSICHAINKEYKYAEIVSFV
jgi:hypothetical protein